MSRERITVKHLSSLCERLNKITGSPEVSWTKGADGKNRASIGHYYIDGAYGGWSLERMVNEGGGVTTPLGGGHVPARELYGLIRAYMAGMQDEK